MPLTSDETMSACLPALKLRTVGERRMRRAAW